MARGRNIISPEFKHEAVEASAERTARGMPGVGGEQRVVTCFDDLRGEAKVDGVRCGFASTTGSATCVLSRMGFIRNLLPALYSKLKGGRCLKYIGTEGAPIDPRCHS